MGFFVKFSHRRDVHGPKLIALGSRLHLTLNISIQDRPRGDWLKPEALLLLVSSAMAWMNQAVKRASSGRQESHLCEGQITPPSPRSQAVQERDLAGF